MNRQHTYLELTGESPNFLKIEVYYHLGGWAIGSGDIEPRGYWRAVTPVTRKEGIETVTALTGVREFLAPAKRLQPKYLTGLWTTVQGELKLGEGPIWKLIEAVLERQKLTLKTPTETPTREEIEAWFKELMESIMTIQAMHRECGYCGLGSKLYSVYEDDERDVALSLIEYGWVYASFDGRRDWICPGCRETQNVQVLYEKAPDREASSA